MALRGARSAPGPTAGVPASGNGSVVFAGDGVDGPPLRALPRRRAPLNARALLGGLLVAVAGVGLFAAFTQAGADHRVAYVVAGHDLLPGERLTAADLTTQRMLLPSELAGSFAFRDASRLNGAVMVAPLRAGELLQASDVVAAADAPDQQVVSFPIDATRAVGGSLQPGETVAVVATYGSGAAALTEVVVPLAQVVSVDQGGGALASRSTESVTLALSSAADVLAVTNAVDAGQIELVRTQTPDAGTVPYRPTTTPAP